MVRWTEGRKSWGVAWRWRSVGYLDLYTTWQVGEAYNTVLIISWGGEENIDYTSIDYASIDYAARFTRPSYHSSFR